MDKPVSEQVERMMKNRERAILSRARGDMIPLLEGEGGDLASAVVAPIISGGDTIGAVLMMSRDAETMGEVELKLCETAAHFMGKQMES